MFNIFKTRTKKDPICGMEDNGKFVSKYGEKFCSQDCIQKYEKKNNIADPKKTSGSGCCH